MEQNKTCLSCGEILLGRSDKKFCDDQCRSNYNNKANSDVTSTMRNINNALRKNRRILKALTPEGKARVSRQKLTDKGFSFKYYTHTHTTQKGSTYMLCYDYGWLPIDTDYIMIIKWGVFNT
jgi:hypothetical protein